MIPPRLWETMLSGPPQVVVCLFLEGGLPKTETQTGVFLGGVLLSKENQKENHTFWEGPPKSHAQASQHSSGCPLQASKATTRTR